MGAVELPLKTIGSDGATYKLAGAKFQIEGTQSVAVNDTSADTVVVPLQAGPYTILLKNGWHMERVDGPGGTVDAALVSPNPQSFVVKNGLNTAVTLRFKRNAGEVDIGFTLDGGGWITGTFTIDYNPAVVNGTPSTHAFDTVVGKPIQFAITWASATLAKADTSDFPPLKELSVTTSPVSIQFGGDPDALLSAKFPPTIDGTSLIFNLIAAPPGKVQLDGFNLFGPAAPEYFAIEIHGGPARPGHLDSAGYPTSQTISFPGANVILRRYITPFAMTDYASGSVSIDVAAQ